MASGNSALGWLTSTKGTALAAAGVLAVAALVGIARSDRTAAPAKLAEAAKTDPSGTFNPAQVASIQHIVREYLVNNPDVMVEITKEIERRQQAQQAVEQLKVLTENKAKVFSQPTDYVYGNPKGDVTVVEFFDYNCGWCKKAIDDVQKLTKADPKVRVVMKDFPIFGEASHMAALAALASHKQGKYWDYHVAMMREKQITKENIFPIAERVGIDVAKLKADMADPALEAHVKETNQIAQALNIEGTPGFIVDGKVNVGYVPAEGLAQMIGEVRKTGCQMCSPG